MSVRRVVNVSGGLSSYEALRRTIAAHGRENVEAVFADVKGESQNEHDGEDPDTYRFLADVERILDFPITRLREGRTVWDVLRDERAISMIVNGNRVSPCSKKLKRELLDNYVESRYQPGEVVQVIGYKWHEQRRMDQIRRFRAPYLVEFPLAEAPIVDDCQIAADLLKLGVEPPALYTQGYPHNNCGGFCIHAGQAQFALLWRTNPARYAYHEGQEARFHRDIRDDVTILRDRRNNESKPLSLSAFRRRLESGENYDRHDWGGCGCFVTGMMQPRLDLEVIA